IVRPGVFPFGPRDRTTFLPLAAELERGRGGYLRGGRALITTAYVENLTQGLRLALERPEGARETFVIGDDGEITWRQLFSSFAEGLGVRPPRLSLPFPLAYAIAWAWEGLYSLFRVQRAPLLTRYRTLLAGRDCHFISTKAKRLLGYKPTIDLGEAVARTARWYHDLRPR
ncbi:MAG: hypothetical protein KAI47_17675, partial [Deltaproteobacteria bacterium]|nr:hypothetical protein [Deltaproteobacteria bacterium]